MILLPVIERELRTAARRRQTYRNRFLAALGITGVLLWVIYDSRGQPESLLGSEIFDFITMTALCLALLAGFFHTADSISEERREGTLGLLYLTDLRSLHVVFGKLFAQSLPAFFALATIVPMLAIPFLLGGITLGELERVTLILLNALWLSLAAGLFASTLVKDDRGALLITFLLVIIPALFSPFFGQRTMSAFWALTVAARDRAYLGGTKDEFWVAMTVQFALPFLYLSLAAWRARSLWREKPPSAAGEKRRSIWRVWSGGTAEQRKTWRTEMLDENPGLWLACRRRARMAILWLVLGGAAVWLAWLWFTQHRIDVLVGTLSSIVLHWALKITFAFAACRALSEESRTGAVELLFTTELSPQRLVQGHLWGLARSFGIPVGIVMIADALWASFGRLDSLLSSDGRTLLWWRIAILFFDLVTIAIYGLWLGFKLQRSGRAAIRTLVLVVILPNVAWFFALRGVRSFAPIFLTWFAFDAVLIWLALSGFSRLRELAAERFVTNSAPG